MTPRRLVLVPTFALVCSFFALVIPLRAADQTDHATLYIQAKWADRSGDYKAALEAYSKILEADPNDADSWLARARAKWQLKDRDGALADIARALKLDPDFIGAYYDRSIFRAELKDFEGSLADCNKAIECMRRLPDDEPRFEANSALFARRAEVEAASGDTASAIRDLTSAIKWNPKFPDAYNLRGRLYGESANFAAAEADYTKLIELVPKSTEACSKRAWIRFCGQKWDLALADGQKLEQLTKVNLGLAEGKTGDYDERKIERLFLLGLVQFAKGEYAEAATTLATAADSVSSSDAAVALFIRHYAMLRTGGADKRVARTLDKWTDSPWMQALGKFITGKIDAGVLEAAAKATSDDSELASRAEQMNFFLGLAHGHSGNKSGARSRFQAVLGAKLNPSILAADRKSVV